MRWLGRNWLRAVAHAGSLAPLTWMIWRYAFGLYRVDPIRETTAITGRAGLILLVLSLACTPVRTVLGIRQILQVRRALGLYAFGYVALHFLVFFGWDYGFNLGLIGRDLPYQRYVLVGILTFVILCPLAVTSTRGWRRRLGPKWQWLHYLFYPAIILDLIHFTWLRKEPSVPLRYAAIVGLLLLLRVPPVANGVRSARHWVVARFRAADQG